MTELNKIIAGDIVWRNFFSDEELALDPYSVTADVYLQRLQKNKELNGAVKFIGCCLSHREGVWWACRCYSSDKTGLTAAENDELGKILDWVKNPTGSNQPAEKMPEDEAEQPIPWLKFCSSFYLGDEIPAKPAQNLHDLSAVSYTGAVAMLAARLAKDKDDNISAGRLFEWYNKFIKLGVNTAAGKDRWDYL